MSNQIRRINDEIRPTPKFGPAPADPPPISTAKSLYITRRVRVSGTGTAGAYSITVADIKNQITSATTQFKILNMSAWATGAPTATFVMYGATWNGNNVTYQDLAPLSRLPSMKANIPDTLAVILSNGTDKVLDANSSGVSGSITGLVADFTVQFLI
jgi:hypothetical protein